MNFSPQQIKDALAKLSENLRKFAASEKLANDLYEINTKYNFDFDKARAVGAVTGYIMMGLLKKEEFKAELKLKAPSLTEETVEKVYQDVDRVAFSQMQNPPEIYEEQSDEEITPDTEDDDYVPEEGDEQLLEEIMQEPVEESANPVVINKRIDHPNLENPVPQAPAENLPAVEEFDRMPMIKKEPFIKTEIANSTPATTQPSQPIQPAAHPKSILDSRLSGTFGLPQQEVNMNSDKAAPNQTGAGKPAVTDPYREPPTP